MMTKNFCRGQFFFFDQDFTFLLYFYFYAKRVEMVTVHEEKVARRVDGAEYRACRMCTDRD